MSMKIRYRSSERTTVTVKRGDVTFLTYKIFEGQPLTCAVSTRLGGVSSGYLGTMNMSTSRGDDPENVAKNRRIFAQAAGYDDDRLVMSDQIHETRILKVEKEDAGGGVICRGTDGLMTDALNVPLMSFYADCVPLMFYDTKNHVAAMAHSGWRGTVSKIGAICLDKMYKAYGTRPEDVLAAIGPSICQTCYEVDLPLLDAFAEAFGDAPKDWFLPAKDDTHFYLDLASACRYTLLKAGVREDRIAMPDLCTCCNPQFLFSHRASGGKRGNISVVMMLRTK